MLQQLVYKFPKEDKQQQQQQNFYAKVKLTKYFELQKKNIKPTKQANNRQTYIHVYLKL